MNDGGDFLTPAETQLLIGDALEKTEARNKKTIDDLEKRIIQNIEDAFKRHINSSMYKVSKECAREETASYLREIDVDYTNIDSMAKHKDNWKFVINQKANSENIKRKFVDYGFRALFVAIVAYLATLISK